jgi:hypothetical protein
MNRLEEENAHLSHRLERSHRASSPIRDRRGDRAKQEREQQFYSARRHPARDSRDGSSDDTEDGRYKEMSASESQDRGQDSSAWGQSLSSFSRSHSHDADVVDRYDRSKRHVSIGSDEVPQPPAMPSKPARDQVSVCVC